MGEVFEQTSNLVNPKSQNLELWSLTVEKGLTPKTERYNRDFLVKKNDKFKKVYNNEFIYNPMNMTLGAVDLNLTGKSVAVSGYYITMTTKNEFDSKYFATWLKTPIAIKKYKIYATGSLIERQRIQFPTLSQIKAYLPSFEEQQQIGSLYKRLDDIIELHQRKINILKSLKQELIIKMFSNIREKPEVRFNEFKESWQSSNLGNLLKEFNNKSKREDEYKVFSSTNSGMEMRSGRVSGSSNKGYKIINIGDLVLSPQNLWLGNININKLGIGLVSPSYKTFQIKEVDANFLKPQFRTKRMLHKYKNASTQGASVVRRNLDMNLFYQIKIKEPGINEKNQIGYFFNQFDNQLNLQSKKLYTLQELKKSYLRKMFL